MKTVWTFLFLTMAEIVTYAAVSILFKKKRTKKGLRVLAHIAFLALIIFTLRFAVLPPVKGIDVTGTHSVASEDYWLTLDTKDPFSKKGELRELQIRKWYPEDASNGVSGLPVVVASHGSCGSIDNNISLYKELASHGYVVLAVGHTGHAASVTLSNGKNVRVSSELLSDLSKHDAQKDSENAAAVFKKWMDLRVSDLDAVMTDYKEKNNTEKFVALGHSAGGSTAYGIARKREDVVAVIALESPFMADVEGVKDDKFIFNLEPYNIPMLNIYSDASYSKLSEWKQYEENAILLNVKSDSIKNLHYEGIKHMGLCDLSISSPLLAAMIDGGFPEKDAKEILTRLNQDVMDFMKDIQ